MKLTVAGGVGEHGRNCFYVESSTGAFLLDCGTMPGSDEPYPRLTDNQIKYVKWLFISHSHVDHTGAYDWLCKHGFTGRVVLTKETSKQVPFSPKCVCLIDELTPALLNFNLDKGLSVLWGKSGQCAGSVWYRIDSNGESILFSGDYIEDTLVYLCDPIRDITADIAILDSAYGDAEYTHADYCAALVNTIMDYIKQKKTVLFPVPKFGRGLELLVLLYKHFTRIPIKLDEHLKKELSRVDDFSEWIKPAFLADIKNIPFSDVGETGFIFISDPQLKTSAGQDMAKEIINRRGKIIVTGHADAESYSEHLLKSGQATPLRYPVHLSNAERNGLECANSFVKVVGYHH